MGGDAKPACRPGKSICLFLSVLCAAMFAGDPAHSQRAGAPVPNKPQLGTLGERVNSNTIAIVSGNLNATYLTIAYDMSAVLDDGDGFRILPIVGRGGGQNIKDVR